MTAAPHLRLVEGQRGELELNTTVIRNFLEIGEAEPIELTAFVEGRIHVAHALSEADHVRLLREAEQIRGFNGAYQLVNGPIDPTLLARYETSKWHRAWNGRATDRDIQMLRAVFIDCDPVRPKGVSATDEQRREAWEASAAIEDWLGSKLTKSAIGHGSSGNGYFTLIALEPRAPSTETTTRIGRFLMLLNKKFGTSSVKIDISVANPARLMPAPGTWKRKGVNTPERPHRMTSFVCRPSVRRVPLEEIA